MLPDLGEHSLCWDLDGLLQDNWPVGEMEGGGSDSAGVSLGNLKLPVSCKSQQEEWKTNI